ncbi:hypothetical protein AN0008.2 [Aspergillus nidulans FGSC A4]|nr:hypothetical protein AN0008.2 [Aspergillus nidulans FGSC A4]|eukprot:XP_657612.1 hypothetical protein AN0008.2 [Aspergillus nidulans FGSC A4]
MPGLSAAAKTDGFSAAIHAMNLVSANLDVMYPDSPGLIATAADEGKPVLINEVMYWFAFDSVGDFAFSEDFGMLRNEGWHDVIWMFRSALALLGPFSPAIWMPRLAFSYIPGLWRVKWWFNMLEFCDRCMEQRMKKTPKESNIASWFLKDHKVHRQNAWLSGDTATLVVAGRGYIKATPMHQHWYICFISSHGTLSTPRRYVLTFGSRTTQPEGLTVEGTFIPGGVKISAPRYTIGRLKSAFAETHEFIPEWWYSRPDLVKDRRAFAPFGVGSTSCVGKSLALAQIRLVTAALVSKYKFQFTPGMGSGEAVEGEMREQLTAQPGHCYLNFIRHVGQE